MGTTFSPDFTRADGVVPALRRDGFAVLAPGAIALLGGGSIEALAALAPSWNDLPPDGYLRDGGRYRRRRHACFVLEGDALVEAPRRAHWQPVEYNALHGGMQRWFEPIDASVVQSAAWRALLVGLGRICSAVRQGLPQRWLIEAHQFRIDTSDGIGRPTPEGAHRDGVDFVAVLLIARERIKGGETRVFEAHGPGGQRFTLSEPWTLLLLDDARVIHETTPIQPLSSEPAAAGWRDTLVLTYRAGGFQGD